MTFLKPGLYKVRAYNDSQKHLNLGFIMTSPLVFLPSSLVGALHGDDLVVILRTINPDSKTLGLFVITNNRVGWVVYDRVDFYLEVVQ